MLPETEKRLLNEYHTSVEELEALVGRNLEHWKAACQNQFTTDNVDSL